MRDAIATAIALEGFHHQADVLALANLAQIVNVLHAPVMTEGGSMWVTPTYYALQLHMPHIGATALPVDVTQGEAMVGGDDRMSAVTGTASLNGRGTAVTLTNRHFNQAASITLTVPQTSGAVTAKLLSADSPKAVNSVQTPSAVGLSDLSVHADGAGQWRIELPAHSMATIQFA
jgi:alpha-N-arabinofuranosidase